MGSFRENNKKFIKKQTLFLQERYKSRKYNIFTKKINKIALSVKSMITNTINYLIEINSYATSKGLVCKTDEIRCKYKKAMQKCFTLILL